MSPATSSDEVAPPVRLDRWLWAARFYRSRSLAAQACDGGKVTVNGNGAKPHKMVRAGDMVEITRPGWKSRLRVLALSERRGPAGQARLLYEDLTPPRPRDDAGPSERGGARPTKRDRRRLDRLRG